MIEVKELDKQDLGKAMEVYCECFNKERKSTTLPLLGTVIGAYLNEELIGVAQIDYINNIFEDTRIGYINNVCIKSKYRNMGYGTILLNKCIDVIKENGGNIVNLTSNKSRVYAHMLYKKLGLEIVDTILLKKNI